MAKIVWLSNEEWQRMEDMEFELSVAKREVDTLKESVRQRDILLHAEERRRMNAEGRAVDYQNRLIDLMEKFQERDDEVAALYKLINKLEEDYGIV